MLARSLRLGSLRARSQVIRAHWVWRVNDERGRARVRIGAHLLTRSKVAARKLVSDSARWSLQWSGEACPDNVVERVLSGSPLMNACSLVAPRQLACGLASDSRTRGAARARRAWRCAHHLLAPPLLIRRLEQSFFLTRSRRLVESSKGVSLILVVASTRFREANVSIARSLPKPFSGRNDAPGANAGLEISHASEES